MRKQSSFSILLLIVLVILNSPTLNATPALWKIKSATAEVYLFGSIHVGNKAMYPLAEAIKSAYANSKHLVVEVDILAPSMLKSLGWLLLNGSLADAATLSQILDKKTLQQLQQVLRQYKIPYSSLERLKPWVAALNLENLNMTSAELKPELGIDIHFLLKAHAQNKSIIALESAEEQFNLFENMTMAQQVVFLKSTLEQIISSEDILTKLVSFWQKGDSKKLEKLILSEMKNDPDERFFYDLLLTNRNKKMAKKIAEFLKTNDSYFVVVGAAHFLGPDSIIRFLNDQGISVKRIN